MKKYNPRLVKLFQTVKSLNHQTELLEAFDWDEDEMKLFLESFSEYIQTCGSIDELDLYLKSNYNDSVTKIILEIVKDEGYDLFLLTGE